MQAIVIARLMKMMMMKMMVVVNSVELIATTGHHAATTAAASHYAIVAHDYNRTLRLVSVTSRFKHALAVVGDRLFKSG